MPRNSDFPEYTGIRSTHSGGWDPTKYRNYVDEGSLERGRKGKELPKVNQKRPRVTDKSATKKTAPSPAETEYHTLHIDPEIQRLSKLHPEHLDSIDR